MKIELKEGGEVALHTINPETGDTIIGNAPEAADLAIVKTWAIDVNESICKSCSISVGGVTNDNGAILEIPITIPGDLAALSANGRIKANVPPDTSWEHPGTDLRVPDGRGVEADVKTALNNIIAGF